MIMLNEMASVIIASIKTSPLDYFTYIFLHCLIIAHRLIGGHIKFCCGA